MNTVGVFSTMGDTILCNLNTVGDIMMHVGISGVLWGVQHHGSIQITKDFPPMVLMISPTVLNPHAIHDIPHSTEHPTVLKISLHYDDIPHSTEHPPTVLKISPTVLHACYTG